MPTALLVLAAAVPPPVVVGPRRTTETAPTYRFVVRGVPNAAGSRDGRITRLTLRD